MLFCSKDLGGDGNSLTKITKQINGDVVAKVYEQNILSEKKPVKVVLEVLTDGTIKIWTSHNPYAPLLEWKDPQPVPVKYLSFSSKTRIQFFYNVDEDGLLSVATKPVKPPVKVKHPILSALEFPLGLAQLCKYKTSFFS